MDSRTTNVFLSLLELKYAIDISTNDCKQLKYLFCISEFYFVIFFIKKMLIHLICLVVWKISFFRIRSSSIVQTGSERLLLPLVFVATLTPQYSYETLLPALLLGPQVFLRNVHGQVARGRTDSDVL